MVVGFLEHPVVEGLPVVRVGAGLEQQPGQRVGMLVRRLVVPVLAAAERPGQRGERRGQPLPEVAGIRVGAGIEQQPGADQAVALGRLVGQPAVAEVEQWRPTERAGLGVHRSGVEVAGDLGDVPRRRGGSQAGPGELGMLARATPAAWSGRWRLSAP